MSALTRLGTGFAVVLATPGVAAAATVEVTGTSVVYGAEPKEANDVTVRVVVGATTTFEFEEHRAPLAAGSGCTPDADARRVRCEGAGVLSVEIVTGGHDDRVTVANPLPVLAVLDGGAGDDTLVGGLGRDRLLGRDGSDILFADAGDDELFGGGGNDLLDGGWGADVLDGAAGLDFADYSWRMANLDISLDGVDNDGEALEGDDARATLEVVLGGGGADTLWMANVRAGLRALFGAGGDDTLVGSSGDDWLDGGPGNDSLSGRAGDDLLDGRAGKDIMAGEGGSDLLDGGSGKDTMAGGAGIDLLDAGPGPDHLSGGDATDLLDGGAGDDVMLGGAASDLLVGGAGTDDLQGGSGDDVVVARGPGRDVVRCGRGADVAFLGRGDREQSCGSPRGRTVPQAVAAQGIIAGGPKPTSQTGLVVGPGRVLVRVLWNTAPGLDTVKVRMRLVNSSGQQVGRPRTERIRLNTPVTIVMPKARPGMTVKVRALTETVS